MVTSAPISAVSPITTPTAWSMNRPGPTTAAGWMSTPVQARTRPARTRAAERVAGEPQPVGDPVTPQCVETRIAERDLDGGAGRRVPLADGGDVAPESPEHGQSPRPSNRAVLR